MTNYVCDECGYSSTDRLEIIQHLADEHDIIDAGQVGAIEQENGILRLIQGTGESVTEIDLADWLKEQLEPEPPESLFELGEIVGTPGALDAFEQPGADPATYLRRHATGDWGELDKEDKVLNDQAVTTGARIFSAYTLPDDTRIWIITEADRTVTTILLPEKY